MSDNIRDRRLESDLQAMQALKRCSTLFDFEPSGQPPDRYTLIFRGQGICRDTTSSTGIKTVDLHHCDLRLPYSYPQRPPDIRWLTPVFHPNISFSGFIGLEDISLPWNKDLGLDAVCERLWDIARMAYLNLENATNHSARNWFEEQRELSLPTDHRSLRDKAAPSAINVIRYQQLDQRGAALSSSSDPSDVFYIGENTPTPEMPQRSAVPRRISRGDDDILYIGDEDE